jgi:hypothetical protein
MIEPKYTCYNCNSPRVVNVRHDSDWGSSHAQSLINDESFYEPQDCTDEYLGDIRIRICLNCGTIL